MSNSTDTAISVQETINAQKEKIIRIVGVITQESVDNLEEEIAAFLMSLKFNHFKERHTNGHIAVIITVEEYRTIICDNAWMYDPSVDVNAYDPIASNATSAV